MASIDDVRNGLATQLKMISGLRVESVPPSTISAPCAVVYRRRTNFDSTMHRGSDEHEFVVTVYIATANNRNAWASLDAYMAGSGASSIKAAIEADQTLGGVVSYARVASIEEDRIVEIPANSNIFYASAEFVVEVLTQ